MDSCWYSPSKEYSEMENSVRTNINPEKHMQYGETNNRNKLKTVFHICKFSNLPIARRQSRSSSVKVEFFKVSNLPWTNTPSSVMYPVSLRKQRTVLHVRK